MAENTDPTADAEDKSPDSPAFAQRKAFGSKRHAVTPAAADGQPAIEEKLADIMDSVKGLQSQLAGSRPIDASPAPPGTPRARGPKRFQRRGGDELPSPEPSREPVLDHEIRGTEATLNKNIAWPRISRPEPTPVSFGARGLNFIQRHPFIIWLVVQATGLGLILLGYWAGSSFAGGEDERADRSEDRTSSTKAPAPDLLARVGVNDRAMNTANAAMHEEKSGSLDTARKAYEDAVTSRVRLPGTEYRLAMLDIARQEYESADIHLNNSLAAGELLAPCYFVNAWFASRKTDYPAAAKQLAHASRLEPFNAKYLFCHGEALRRAGNAQTAVEVLGQALDRPGAPADMELIRFKQQLAKVEYGQDEAFNADLAAHLAQSPVSGDWLLLAAAQDLTHAAYPAAATHLTQAAKGLTPYAFSVLIQDYLYQGYANRPEVAPILRMPVPQPSTGPLDIAAWPFSEADPATWPPFAPAL